MKKQKYLFIVALLVIVALAAVIAVVLKNNSSDTPPTESYTEAISTTEPIPDVSTDNGSETTKTPETTVISSNTTVVDEIVYTIEKDYTNENGIVELEQASKLIDAVYNEVNQADGISYCEKNDFSIYMILDNGLGVHYNAPVENLASAGNEIVIYSYQPFHEIFNSSAGFLLPNLTDGEYPDKAVKALLSLDITASNAKVLHNENATIESVKNIKGGSVIIWISHGGYSTQYHSTLCLSVEFTDELYNTYRDDFDKHRMEISYAEGSKSVCLTSLFFDYYFDDDALNDSLFYLGTCHSGEDKVLANALINKGASAVYVNSDTIYQVYNNRMCRTIIESLCDGSTVADALKKAKKEHGEKDNTLWGILKRDTIVYYVGNGELTLYDLYTKINEEETTAPHTHSFGSWKVTKNSTCTSTGERTRTCSCGKKETATVEALGHTVVIDKAIAATCTNTGLTEGKHCSTCNAIIVAQIKVNALGHTEVVDKAIASNCTTIGYTEGKHCSVCNTVIVTQTPIPATDHNFANGKCTMCGLTEKQSLEFTLNSDGKSYTVTGIGTCTDKDVVIPEKYNGLPVTMIGVRAFSGCTDITSIKIPDSVTAIYWCAFEYCSSLKSINIPNGVTYIDEDTFAGCTSLTSINIPNGVTSIGFGAFWKCSSLTSVTIPDSVTSIGGRAFDGCTKLTKINIPNGLTSIDELVFADCLSLTSITIPNSVTIIRYGAFSGCSNLTSVKIPNKVTAIDEYVFYCCSSLKDVYYTGTEAEWKAITIGSDNYPLINATIHYNSKN